MLYISEQAVIDLVDQATVNRAVESVYAAMASGDAVNFPVVRETLGYADAIFGFKSGFDRSVPVLGVKAGGLWPGNRAKGIANHQSTIVLFDCETGSPSALVRGTYLTALRTAAASAISIRHLARADAQVLGILGAGGQSIAQVKAAIAERRFTRLMIADQSADQAEELARALNDTGLDIGIASPKEMASASDVIITVTPSRAPVIESGWVRPGTHLACMGADTKGKQEVDSALVARSQLFIDELAQAISIGECQHAYAEGLIGTGDLVPIGSVINKAHAGRTSAEQITIFDSTGVGLQDIAAARLAVELATAAGRAVVLED